MKGSLQDKNRRFLMTILAVVASMIGLSFAAVPLYKVFCQATGFGGTVKITGTAPDADKILNRLITVKFNTDVTRNMLWTFHPDQRQIDVLLGQQGIVSFFAENQDKVPVTGVAIYNVTPPKAGKYFHKTQCFCFGQQSLDPGEKVHYPVVFYIDPSLNDDPNMEDVRTITLSYTFFPAETPELEKAMDDFYTQAGTAGTVALPDKKQ